MVYVGISTYRSEEEIEELCSGVLQPFKILSEAPPVHDFLYRMLCPSLSVDCRCGTDIVSETFRILGSGLWNSENVERSEVDEGSEG